MKRRFIVTIDVAPPSIARGEGCRYWARRIREAVRESYGRYPSSMNKPYLDSRTVRVKPIKVAEAGKEEP